MSGIVQPPTPARLEPGETIRPISARPNSVRIAVLEHDLLGVHPRPGTAAALAVGLRGAGTCLTHQPVADTETVELVSSGVCARCGRALILADSGDWEPTP